MEAASTELIQDKPLTFFGCGVCVLLRNIKLDNGQAERLREMGLCEGRCVSVIQNSDKLIVQCGGTRIGLHKGLATCLLGTEVASTAPVRQQHTGGWFGRINAFFR